MRKLLVAPIVLFGLLPVAFVGMVARLIFDAFMEGAGWAEKFADWITG